MNQNKHVFKLSYDSTSTDDHTIDAEVLGKSLLNLSGLIKESTKVLNGEEATARIEVQAHEQGSFVVECVAWLQDGGLDVLRSLGIASSVSALAVGNVFAALKALRNRQQVEKHIRNGNTTLVFEDGERITIPESVDKLLSNHSVRTKIEQVIKRPSELEDGATVRFLSENDVVFEEISPDEVEFFKAPPRRILAEEITTTETINVIFTVVALESKKGWKIRLPDGEEVNALMNDEGFIERINTRERQFIKGDMFEIELKTVERILDGSSTVKRLIERVLRHRVESSRKVL